MWCIYLQIFLQEFLFSLFKNVQISARSSHTIDTRRKLTQMVTSNANLITSSVWKKKLPLSNKIIGFIASAVGWITCKMPNAMQCPKYLKEVWFCLDFLLVLFNPPCFGATRNLKFPASSSIFNEKLQNRAKTCVQEDGSQFSWWLLLHNGIVTVVYKYYWRLQEKKATRPTHN